MRQSSLKMPAGSRVRLGPVQLPLSCMPDRDVIKRLPVVRGSMVKLPERYIVDLLPVVPAVIRHRQAAIVAFPHAPRIFLVDPQRVKIAVHAGRQSGKNADRHLAIRGAHPRER